MILEAKEITKEFAVEAGFFKRRVGTVKALDRVSFSVDENSSLGIVGESGSGKTTLAKIILKLIEPTSGEIAFDAQKITNFRKDVQIIFQNPYNSLNPKMRIFDILSEPLLLHHIVPKENVRGRLQELLIRVGMEEPDVLNRFPLAFSGGQRQRICIARALACEPKILVLDEPISSLDLTIQCQILELFLKLKKELGLTYIFISHNLAVINQIADTILVIHGGQIVEKGRKEDIFGSSKNEYTQLLLQAARS